MSRPVLARRDQVLRGGQPLAFGVGLLVALVVGVVLLMGSGHDPIRVYERMFDASLGGSRAWSVTLNRAVPLGLAGLAVAVAGSMGLWNIGAEGQIMAGAIGATWVARIRATHVAPIAPAMIWPSAPMFQRPIEPATATAKPARPNGTARFKVTDQAREPPREASNIRS